MKYIDAEITGTEITYLKPRKHPFRVHIADILWIVGIAAAVGTALWWTWNR